MGKENLKETRDVIRATREVKVSSTHRGGEDAEGRLGDDGGLAGSEGGGGASAELHLQQKKGFLSGGA